MCACEVRKRQRKLATSITRIQAYVKSVEIQMLSQSTFGKMGIRTATHYGFQQLSYT
ncbi:hypothetical protein MTR_1g041575 [Medicago truncatula]|uniref:Uncharacterized protein n=1 Tax=Medicago truncatula TaxID=3880 RepID=A0A072VHI3_MEDTR|nr:hypothetical protein MTR_1g041575 [Medicago truncatula]